MRGTMAKKVRHFADEEGAKGNIPEGAYKSFCHYAKRVYKQSKEPRRTPKVIPLFPKKRHPGEDLKDFRDRRRVTNRRKRERRIAR